MVNRLSIPDAIDQVGRNLQQQYGNKPIPREDIVREVVKLTGHSASSILPTDFSYNRTNLSARRVEYCVFEEEGRGYFRYVGRGISSEQLRAFKSDSRKVGRGVEVVASASEGVLVVKSGSRNVFLVHGHDEAVKESVARFLERLELTPIILHEQPNKGRTVIEKFEAHSDVGFAVVLLTPDDKAKLASAGQFSPRARQNVILELGYFVGKLGRARVCALYKEGVEIPSDIHGVLYVPYDAHKGWHLKLAHEIRAAGITVDLNRA